MIMSSKVPYFYPNYDFLILRDYQFLILKDFDGFDCYAGTLLE